MKRYYKITTNTPDETVVTGLSEPWLLLDKSETSKDNFIFQRSINNLTLDLCEGYGFDDVNDFVNRDEEHALMCMQNTDNTYTVIYKKEKTELSSDLIYQYCKNIILPNSITKINPEMFKDFSNLENITLPNSISEIGDGAFYGCENLTIIKVPSRVTRINSNLFNSCKNLTKAYIPNNIHYISKIAFNECENLTEIILYNELTNNEKHCYANENGEISIDYYDENGELKNIIIDIKRTGNKEWELHELTPDNNVILYKTHSGNKYDFDDGANTSYVEGYTINDDGSHSQDNKLYMVDNNEAKDFDGYNIRFPQNTNISKIIGDVSGVKQWFYFESTDLTEIYLPVSVTNINNCVFNTPNLSTLLLPSNISLKQCKLPDNTDEGIYDLYVETLHNCGKLKNILYNGTSEEFNKIISNSDTSDTWYKDLPYKFTVTCLDKVLNFVNNYKYEILYKAPLVANRDYAIKRVSTSIYITTSELTPTNDNYNILQFDYTSDKKKLNGYYEASNGGYECYCLQSDAITELVLPNGIEEIDALAFNCPNLTTITLPNSIKRFKTVRYTDVWSADLETVNRTLIFGSNIETIYFNGTEYEWNAIDKNLNWNPEGKTVRVICRDKEFNIESVDDAPYQMVDLGLPSGLIWADRNIGAETPQDNGLYFSWGNIEGHAVDENGDTMYGYSFDRNTYNETLGSQYTGSKLAAEYDAATANMGGEWHMPTIEDISELVENTKHYYIDDDGNTVKRLELSSSRKLRSICFVKKGVDFNYYNRSNFIEFPFAGYCSDSSLWNDGYHGCSLSSSIFKSDTKSACCLAFLNTGYLRYDGGLGRHLGSTVRGVRGPLEYKMIDLGLPSGIKWADRNVGAETPQDNGLYFSWGNTDGHVVDEAGNTVDGYSFDEDTYSDTPGGQYTDSTLDAEHDAATVNMKGEWRIPTNDETLELIQNTNHYYINEDGSTVGPFNHETPPSDKGLDVSKLRSICFVKRDIGEFDYNVRGNFIEFPFASYCNGSSLNYDGLSSGVWSNHTHKYVSIMANYLSFSNHGSINSNGSSPRLLGRTVRGVYSTQTPVVPEEPETPVDPEDKPLEYIPVDLGLSIKWANRNVGAENPWDNGLYFDWGNVEGHAVDENGYTIDEYPFADNMYLETPGGQYTDSELDAEHDAAVYNMGEKWRMPTVDELIELLENTYYYYIYEDGVNFAGPFNYETNYKDTGLDGSKLRSICFVKKDTTFDYSVRDNFIEFPFAGFNYDSLLKEEGTRIHIWSSSIYKNNPTKFACGLDVMSNGIIISHHNGGFACHCGCSIRGVYIDETVETPEDNQIEYQKIDLGLPSGTKWANKNVGALLPRDSGLYFSWGNTDGHAVDEAGNTVDGYSFKKSTYSGTPGGQYSGSKLDTEHDAAKVNMGEEWRIPTSAEIIELVENTDHYYIDLDGFIVGGPFNHETPPSDKGLNVSKLRSICFVKKDIDEFDYNVHGNFIEIPFAERCSDTSLTGDNTCGEIWANSVTKLSGGASAYSLYFGNNGYLNGESWYPREFGLSVRGVCGNEIPVNPEIPEIPVNPEIPEVPVDPEVPEKPGGSDTGGDTGSTAEITEIEVCDENRNWEKISSGIYISRSAYMYIRITGTNLVTHDNKFNFTFIGNSTSEGIEDPNNTVYWIYNTKSSTKCEVETVVEGEDGITLNYPFTNPAKSN